MAHEHLMHFILLLSLQSPVRFWQKSRVFLNATGHQFGWKTGHYGHSFFGVENAFMLSDSVCSYEPM